MTPFPFSDARPVEHDPGLPEAADVVVIGGGVIGVTAAGFLAHWGKRVVLCEKGRISGEQSSRNWGWIRVQGRDEAEIPIAQEAQRLWRELAREADTDIGLTQGGVAYLAANEDEMAGFARWQAMAAAHGTGTELLSRRALQALIPGQGGWPGALWTASDMRAEPFLAVPALARLAAAEGAVVAENCAVRALDIEAGRVAGVITERGRIRADAVVLAGGAWTSLLLRRHGVSIPQLSVRATAMQTVPLPDLPGGFAGGAADDRLAFRRRADGGYTLAQSGFHELFIGPDAFRHLRPFWPQIRADLSKTRFRPAAPRAYPDAWTTPRRWTGDGRSPFEAMRVLNPPANAKKAEQVRRAFAATFPELGEVRLERAWAGMIDVMPDVVPVVDRVARLPGLTVATGMSGHGFGIGPAYGRIAAALATGTDPGHDLSRFRLSRFSDGTRLDLGESL